MDIDGILLIDKPQGWTSFDVVAKTRGIINRALHKKVKVGHSGTLDPMASGLLILAIGRATKSIETLMKKSKTYEAEVTLGARSSTDDAEGEISHAVDKLILNEAEIMQTLQRFEGVIEQLPPQFSAIKVDGKRAYKLARSGQSVKLKPRSVEVHIRGVEIDLPPLRFIADVSSGTYIRALARDIGDNLGVGGYLSGLRRTSIGEFSVQDALPMDGLNIELIQQHLKKA